MGQKDCRLCRKSFPEVCGKQLSGYVLKVLREYMPSELPDLTVVDEFCKGCFYYVEKLRCHSLELKKIRGTIKEVVMCLKARFPCSVVLEAVKDDSRYEIKMPIKRKRTSSTESLDENIVTALETSAEEMFQRLTSKSSNQQLEEKPFEEEVEAELPAAVEIKREVLDNQESLDELPNNVDFPEFFCGVEGDAEHNDNQEAVDVKPNIAGNKTQQNHLNNQIEVDINEETTEFIISQLLSSSESYSDSDWEDKKPPPAKDEKVKRLKRKPVKARPVSQIVKNLKNSQKRNLRKQTSSHLSTLVESECELCEPKTTFPSIVALSQHYEMDHRDTERVFFCETVGCDEKLLTYDFLEIHKKCHFSYEWREMTGEPMYHRAFCNYCTLSSYFPDELRNHELQIHSNELEFFCSTCRVKYSTQEVLDAHLLQHAANVDVLECPLCPDKWKFKYPNKQDYESHLIRIHAFPLDYAPNGTTRLKNLIRGDGPPKCKKCGNTLDQKKRHRCPEKIYRCEICNQKCGCVGTLVSHSAARHEGKKNKSQWKVDLTCNKCGQQFSTQFMYKRHLNCHNLESKFEFYCSECEQRFATESLLSRHKEFRHHPATHSVKLSHIIVCEVCGKIYNSVVNMRKHEREEHPHLFVFECTKCKDTFSKSEFLETHLKTHEPVGPYLCLMCPKLTFSNGEELEAHLKKAHTVGSGKTCPTCGEKFQGSVELARHRSGKHGEPMPLQCSVCKRGFVSPTEKRMHEEMCMLSEDMRMKKALETRKQCEICQKWFSKQSGLNGHIRSIHQGLMYRVCEMCGKTITGGDRAMKLHIKIHLEEKNFACDFCDKRFVRKDALRVHRYTHTGEKPYPCYICDKRFNQHTPLKKHVETHKRDGSWFPKPNPKITHLRHNQALHLPSVQEVSSTSSSSNNSNNL